jgi:hypothetical protein
VYRQHQRKQRNRDRIAAKAGGSANGKCGGHDQNAESDLSRPKRFHEGYRRCREFVADVQRCGRKFT